MANTLITIMADTASLQRLLTWLSPAFPVGAFAYSAGLETVIADNTLTTAENLANWLEGNLCHGTAHSDAIILASAHTNHTDKTHLHELADLCLALTPARERHEELTITGSAFVKAASAWPSDIFERLPDPCPYPIAVGAIASAHAIPVNDTLVAFLTAYAQSQISVAIRLVPLGQTDGLKVLASLEPLITTCAKDAATSTLDEIGSISYASDIATMTHETLNSRIFRS